MNTVRKFKPRSSDTVYLCLLDLYNARVNPSFFESVSQHTIRDCIVENDIPKSHLLYLHNQLVSNSSNSRAHPYVSEEYARDWIYDSNKILRYRESLRNKRWRRTTKLSFSSLNKLLKPLSKPLLELFEEEWLRIEGKPVRIEIRGERAYDKIYFRASDIQRHLQRHPRASSSRNVYGTVVHPNSDYGVNTHYVLLMCEDEHGFAHIDLYLTYFGVVKLLMGTNSRYASSFQCWAIEVLFGSSKTSILQDICNVLKHAVEPVACVYLFRIGTVEEILRFNDRKIEAVNLEGYDEGEIVYKYGVTHNFAQRVKEHACSYARMSTNFRIQTFKPVRPSIVEPLKELIGTFFKDEGLRIDDVKHTELVVIPTTKMSAVFNIDSLLKTNDVTRCCLHAVQNMQRDFELNKKATRDYITEAQFEYIGSYNFNVCDRVRVELYSPLLRRSDLSYNLLKSPENGDWVLEHDKKKNMIVIKTNNYGKSVKTNTSLGFDVYPALPNDVVLSRLHVEERY